MPPILTLTPSLEELVDALSQGNMAPLEELEHAWPGTLRRALDNLVSRLEAEYLPPEVAENIASVDLADEFSAATAFTSLVKKVSDDFQLGQLTGLQRLVIFGRLFAHFPIVDRNQLHTGLSGVFAAMAIIRFNEAAGLALAGEEDLVAFMSQNENRQRVGEVFIQCYWGAARECAQAILDALAVNGE